MSSQRAFPDEHAHGTWSTGSTPPSPGWQDRRLPGQDEPVHNAEDVGLCSTSPSPNTSTSDIPLTPSASTLPPSDTASALTNRVNFNELLGARASAGAPSSARRANDALNEEPQELPSRKHSRSPANSTDGVASSSNDEDIADGRHQSRRIKRSRYNLQRWLRNPFQRDPWVHLFHFLRQPLRRQDRQRNGSIARRAVSDNVVQEKARRSAQNACIVKAPSHTW